MIEVDPGLKDRCEVMQAAYMRRLDQRSVEPTIPLPSETAPTDLVPGQGEKVSNAATS